MPKPEKVERVAELKRRIEGSDALLLTEYRGLTVSDISALRRSLAEGGASFAVVKNTLMLRAAADAGVEELDAMLSGPSAVAFVAGDPVAAAKKVVDAAKLYPSLVLKGGYMDGKILSAEDAKALATLESREVMLSKIAGLLKSEITRAAGMLVSAQSKFLGLLEAYKEKLPPAEAAAEPEQAEPTPAAPEAEPEPEAQDAADDPAAAVSATGQGESTTEDTGADHKAGNGSAEATPVPEGSTPEPEGSAAESETPETDEEGKE
ncbi:MAG: large subunit ribosomal protein [Actinomycetota bacterium]|nr:large subunit ribosomal protein [Actinomycetota bacterium]